MLLNYEVENFTVFKEKALFSMKPGTVTKRFQDNVIYVNPKTKISKVALIIGENASGKSYFMMSLHFLKTIIDNNLEARSISRLCNDPKIDQKFKISIIIGKKIYTYELILDENSVVYEKLSIRSYTLNESRNECIFENSRKSHKIDVNKKKEERFEVENNVGINSKYLPKNLKNKSIEKILNITSRGLMINNLDVFGIEEIREFKDWFKNKLMIDLPAETSFNIYRDMLKDNRDIEIIKKDEFLEIFQLVDSSIFKIEVDDKEPFKESKIYRRRNNEDFILPLKFESAGVNEFFALAIQIYKVIYEDSTLFADEVDRVLNPILSSRIISFIKGSDHSGQFIFSTHNVLHLDTREFMKEQIYFTSKDSYTLTSELYSLGEFKDYKYEMYNVYDLYLKGLLGGVPND